MFLIVPVGAGLAVDALATGGMVHALAGVGAGVLIDRVKAHFPLLQGEAARASHHPGSAVNGMLSVVAGE